MRRNVSRLRQQEETLTLRDAIIQKYFLEAVASQISGMQTEKQEDCSGNSQVGLA